METKYLELFELKYKKIINSAQIMYKTLATYNEMAFSIKKMLKECDLYIQALLVNSLIKSNELNIETLKQLSNIVEYEDSFKKLKLKKLETLDDSTVKKVNLIIQNNINIQPLFIKVASFFDKLTSKIDSSNKIKGAIIIEECLLSMLLFIRNINDDLDLNKYQDDIKIIYNYIER